MFGISSESSLFAKCYPTLKRYLKLCEQFDPDQDRSKLFDTLMVFLKDFLKKLILKKKKKK